MIVQALRARTHRLSQRTDLSPRALAYALGGLLVLYLLTRLSLLWRFPAYFDETFYAHEVPIALHQPTQRFISLQDDKGPLFIWLAFLPYKLGFSPLTSVRIVAQLSGLWSMGMVGLIANRLSDARTALLAMAIFAAQPLWLLFTSIGFDEPLVTAATLSALYLQLRLAERPSARDGVLLGLALGAGLLTKETGKFAVVLLPAGLLVFAWSEPGRALRLARWLGGAVLALIVGYGLYSVERLSPLYYELGRIRKSLGQYTPLGQALEHVGTIFQRNWPGYRVELDVYLTVPLIVAFAVGLGVLLARRPHQALLVLLWIVVPLGLVILIAERPLGHYLPPAVSPAIALMAIGLMEAWRLLSTRLAGVRWRPPALAALAALAILPSLWFDARLIADPERVRLPAYDDRELITDAASGSGWRGLAAIVKQRTRGLSTPVPVLYSGILSYDIPMQLGDPESVRYPFYSVEEPAAQQARFLFSTGPLPPSCTATNMTHSLAFPSCSQLPQRRLRELSSYRRPRGGSVVTLYEVLPPPPATSASDGRT